MNWARAKTILIALMLAVNLILGGVWLYREASVSAGETRAAEALCGVLAENGLFARPEDIPKRTARAYDVEWAGDGASAGEAVVAGLPVWGFTAVFGRKEPALSPVSGAWLWDEALPVRGSVSRSAEQCLLELVSETGQTGTLEFCELGFCAGPLEPGVNRLTPCWRFVISGETVFWLAD